MGCRAWSPDATRLLCQAIRFEGDPSLNGMYTIRAADGRGLRRLTPYGLANSPDNFASAHGPCSPSGRMAPACEQSLSRLLVASPTSSPRVGRHTVRGAALGLARHAW